MAQLRPPEPIKNLEIFMQLGVNFSQITSTVNRSFIYFKLFLDEPMVHPLKIFTMCTVTIEPIFPSTFQKQQIDFFLHLFFWLHLHRERHLNSLEQMLSASTIALIVS